jgi:hypothetical protein
VRVHGVLSPDFMQSTLPILLRCANGRQATLYKYRNTVAVNEYAIDIASWDAHHYTYRVERHRKSPLLPRRSVGYLHRQRRTQFERR